MLLLSQDCGAGPRSRGKGKVRSKANGGGVQFSIAFDKDEYKKTDSMQVTFSLKNNGKKPVYVNRRFHVGKEDSPEEKREIYFVVISPSGEKLPPRDRSYKTGLPKTDYFYLLKPEEETVSERKPSIKGYFDIKDTGVYKIAAIYRNVYGGEIGIDAFSDEVKSKTVIIKVIE